MTAPQESARPETAREHVANAAQLLESGYGFGIGHRVLLDWDTAVAIEARLRAALAALDGEARERENDTAALTAELDEAWKIANAAQSDAIEYYTRLTAAGAKMATACAEPCNHDGSMEFPAAFPYALCTRCGWSNNLAPLPSVTDEPTPLLDAFAAEGRAALAGGLNPVALSMPNTTTED